MNTVPTLPPAMQPKGGRSFADDDQPDVIDSWGRKRKRSNPTPLRDYESEEKCIAECLILLSLSGGGPCLSSSSSAAGATEEENNSTGKNHQESFSPATATAILDDEKHQETSSSANRTSFSTVDANNHQELDPATRPMPPQVNSYKCNLCGKAFASHQALGGHKTGHRAKPTAIAELGVSPSGKRHRHECFVCHKAFQTGVALGGHMRKHYEGKINRSNAKKDETSVPTDIASSATHTTEQVLDTQTNSDQVNAGSVVLILFGKKIYIDGN